MSIQFTLRINRLLSVSLILLLGVLSLTSCGKWKKTTEVNFQFQMNQAPPASFLTFQSGTLIFTDFSFEGERKQGKEVAFHSSNSAGWIVDFASGTTAPPVQFDIPQGTYTAIELEIENDSDAGETIILNGTYTSPLSQQIPVVFQYLEDDVYYFNAEADNGQTEIVLIEGQPATAEIVFDITTWFATITSGMLDQAERTAIGGIETIEISDSYNSDIYELVVSRMEQGNHAIFK